MKSASVEKTRLLIKATTAWIVFIRDRRLFADVLFIRAQSAIRADGTPSAQARTLQLDVFSCVYRMRRAGIARSRPPVRQFLDRNQGCTSRVCLYFASSVGL
jgi:hypothetical protein